MKKFIHEKIHIMVQLVFAGVKVVIQFLISWQGSASLSITLTLSIFMASQRKKKTFLCYQLVLYFNAHPLDHLDISYLRWPIFEENEEHIFDRVRTAFHRHFQQTTPW